MLTIYPACFFTEDTGYSVIFPDLPLATQGDTLEEAMRMAVDCLAGYVKWCQEDGDKIPAPSAISDISPTDIASELEFEYRDAFATMVSVDVAAYSKEVFEKSVKKTLTIPAWLNTAALQENINFSKTLQDALIAKINYKNLSGA